MTEHSCGECGAAGYWPHNALPLCRECRPVVLAKLVHRNPTDAITKTVQDGKKAYGWECLCGRASKKTWITSGRGRSAYVAHTKQVHGFGA